MMPSIGTITADVAFDFNEADLKRTLDRAEASLKQKLTVSLGVDTSALDAGTKASRAELRAMTAESIQGDRARAASARAAAAETAASAAKVREQLAQLTLTTRLSAQADQEAARAGRAAFQARREEIDRLKLAYSKLRAEFDAGETDLAGFNRRGQEIIRTLKLMGERADLTTRELKQLSDMRGRVEREQNSAAGVLNSAGLSGNFAVGLQSALPGLLTGLRQVAALSPSLGAAAAQVSGIGQAAQTVRVAVQGAVPHTLQMGQGLNTAGNAATFLSGRAGAAGVAVNGAGVAAGIAGAAFGSLALLVAGAATAADKAVNEYAKLEFAVAKVSTLTEKTPAQLGATSRELLNMSRELGMSYQDLANGLYDVLGASVEGTEDMGAALKFTGEAAKLAVAGATDTATATDVLTSVMNAYKISAADTKQVSDGLFRAVLDGKMSFNDLAMSLGMVTAISAQAGVPLQEVLAAMATMTANGIRASSSVDYLRSLIKAIVDPSQEARGVFDSLGIAYGDNALEAKGLTGVLREIIEKTGGSTQQMSELLGGVEAVTAATSIASGDFGRMTTNLENQAKAAGSTETAYGKMAGTIQKENDKLKANWAALWATAGEIFAPFKKSMLEDLNEMLNRANELLEKFVRARNLRGAQFDVDRLERGVQTNEAALARSRATLNDPNASAYARGRADYDIPRYEATLRQLRAELAEARRVLGEVTEANRAGARSNLTPRQQGPRLPGDETDEPTGYDALTNSTEYQSAVAMQAIRQTGVLTADEVVNYCAQWVRLTLGKADERAAPFINKLFQTDSNEDGDIEARDALANVRKADLLKSYSGNPRDLKPGDTVFYEDGGAGHVGIYIGNGMVRGNNRVTYQERGGQFDRNGNPISRGIDPVGDVAVNRLGRVSGYVSASDLGRAAGVTEGRPTAPSSTPDPAKNPPPDKSFAQFEKEARRILAQIEKYAPGGAAPDGEKWRKAKDLLEAFSKSSDVAADAISYVRLETKKTGEQASKLGEDYDRLKGKLDIAQSLDNARRPASEFTAILENVRKGAQTAADAEKRLHGETGRYVGLINLVGDATKRLDTIRSRKPDQTELQREQAVQRERVAMEQLEKSIRKAGTARLRQIEEGGVTATVSLAKWEAARKELDRRDKLDRSPRPTDLQREQAALRENLAQQNLEKAIRGASGARLKDILAAGVQKEGDLARWKAADGELKRREQLGRQAVAAARQAAQQTFQDAEAFAQRTEQREKEQAQLRARIADERRQLSVSAAQGELTRTQELSRQELADFRGTAAQRLALVRRQAEDEYQARLSVARATRDKELRESANRDTNPRKPDPNRGTRDDQIRGRYDADELAARGARDAARRQAEEGIRREGEAVTGLTDKYRAAREELKKRADAGTLTADDLTRYAQTLAGYWQEAGRAGIKARPEMVAAYNAARAFGASVPGLNALAIGTKVATDGLENVAEGHTLAALAAGKFQTSIRAAVAGIPEGTEAQAEYVKTLQGMEKEGTLAAGGVKAVTDAIGEQADRLEAWERERAEAMEATARRYGNGQAATDAAYRQSYGAGDVGLIRSLAAVTGLSIARIRADVEGALNDAKRYAPEAAAVIERVWDEALVHRRRVAEEEREFFQNLPKPNNPRYDMGLPTDGSQNMARPGIPALVYDPEFLNVEQAERDRRAAEALTHELEGMDEAQLAVALSAAQATQNASRYTAILAEQRRRVEAATQAQLDYFQSFKQPTGQKYDMSAPVDGSQNIAQPGLTPFDWDSGVGRVLIQEDQAAATKKLREEVEALGDAELETGRAQAIASGDAERLSAIIEEQRCRVEAATRAQEDYYQSLKAGDYSQWGGLNTEGSQNIMQPGVRLVEWAPQAEEANRQFSELQASLDSGASSLEDFARQAGPLAEQWERMAAAAARNNQPGLAAFYRDLAVNLRNMIPVVDTVIDRFERLDRLKNNVQQVGQIVQGIFSMFGNEQVAQGVGELTSAVTGGIEAFAKFASGDILGGILAGVGALGSLGKAIDSLNPAVQRMKKEWLELAQAEQQAMGSKVIGGSFGQNGFANPFYDALKKDADALTRKANAGFWQRLGWSIFGGAPQTLGAEASKSLQIASQVFNDFGQSLYSTLENALMEGINQGDFSNVSENLGKQLDQFVNRMTVQAIIAKSRLGELVKELAEEVAAGLDTSDTLAAIRAEEARVISTVESIAPSLPGYGSGASSSSGGDGGTSNPAQGANFYIANSAKIDLFDTSVTRLADTYARVDAMYLRHEAVVGRFTDTLERLLSDGIRLVDGQGNLRGTFR